MLAGVLLWSTNEDTPRWQPDAAPLVSAPSTADAAPRPRLPAAEQRQIGPHSLPGAVIDAAGTPVADATITAAIELGPGMEVAAEGLETTPVVVAQAGADGMFTLVGLVPGRYRLRVEGDDIVASEVRFFEVPADGVRLMVARTVAVRGQVRDAAGIPAPHVNVTLSSESGGQIDTKTDAQGGFAIANLTEGVFQVWAGAGNRASPAQRVVRLGPGPFAPVSLSLAAAAVVVGRVIDGQTRSGVSAAIVLSATDSEEPNRYGRSDADGNVRIEAVPPGRWSAEAFAPGYIATESIEFRAGGDVAPVIVLTRGGVIAGRVVTHSEVPIAGAVVSVQGIDANGRRLLVSESSQDRRRRQFRGQTHGGSAGEARFVPRGELGVVHGPIPFPPPRGAAALRVAAQIRAPTSPIGSDSSAGGGSLSGAGDGSLADSRDRPGDIRAADANAAGDTGTTSAATTAPAGTNASGPAAGSTAALYVPDDLASRYVTDVQGRFRLTGLPPGQLEVVVTHPDYADGRSKPLALSLGRSLPDVTVVLVPGVVVVGTVTNQGDEPIVGATIIADVLGGPQHRASGPAPAAALAGSPEPPARGRLQAVTGTDGRYRLGPIASDVRLRVTAVRHGDVERTITLGPLAGQLQERTENFALVSADAVLRGRVRDAVGFPVSDVKVVIDTDDRYAQGRVGHTDDTGRFRIENLPPGKYTIELQHQDYPHQRAAGTTEAAMEVALRFGGGITGEVRDAHTRSPVVGARLVATGPQKTRLDSATDQDGAFSLLPLAAGAWSIAFSAPGYVAGSRSVTVGAGERPRQVTVPDLRLQLERGATVAGTVRDANGVRLRGSQVRVGSVTTRTDEEGHFRLRDVPTGDIQITAEHQGAQGSVTVPLRPGDEVVTLEITIPSQP